MQDAARRRPAGARISWNGEAQGSVPPGAEIVVEARTAESRAALADEAYVPVQNGTLFDLRGRFIEVRAMLKRDSGDGASPVLSDLRIQTGPQTPVNTTPVVTAGGDATIAEGSTFTRSGSFTDPDANSWSATVDYGDGDSGPLALSEDKTFELSHVYADNGPYTVTVTVSDGTANGSASFLVTVENVSPTVDAGPDVTIGAGDTFSGSGSFTDPGADIWTATVDYGDGSPVEPLALNSDKTFALSHLYGSAGEHVVTVSVSDDDGGTGTDLAHVTVSALSDGVVNTTADHDDGACGSCRPATAPCARRSSGRTRWPGTTRSRSTSRAAA